MIYDIKELGKTRRITSLIIINQRWAICCRNWCNNFETRDSKCGWARSLITLFWRCGGVYRNADEVDGAEAAPPCWHVMFSSLTFFRMITCIFSIVSVLMMTANHSVTGSSTGAMSLHCRWFMIRRVYDSIEAFVISARPFVTSSQIIHSIRSIQSHPRIAHSNLWAAILYSRPN